MAREYSYYSDAETCEDETWVDGVPSDPMMDGVIMIELEPDEPRIILCDGHVILPSTAISCLETSLKVRVMFRRSRHGNLTIHEMQDPSLMQFRCPCFTSIEGGGIPCGIKYPLEVVSNQMPEEFQEEFEKTVLNLYKRKMRVSACEKIPGLQECPNLKCINEGVDGLGQLISSTTWNMYCKSQVFMVPRSFVRECRSCGWVWCALCKVCFFANGEKLRHEKTTCRDLIDLSDPTSAESLSRKLIERVAVRCPGCRISIAISAGCNRIQCSKCHKHFCYVCRDVAYSSSGECYNHLSRMHGGYYKVKKNAKAAPAKGEIDRVLTVH